MSSIAVYLTIRSAVTSPDSITDTLKIAPAYTCAKGERRREGQTPFFENVWSYQAKSASGESTEEAISEVLNTFSECKDALEELSASCNISCEVNIGSITGQLGVGFPSELLSFLGDINGRLEIDFV